MNPGCRRDRDRYVGNNCGLYREAEFDQSVQLINEADSSSSQQSAIRSIDGADRTRYPEAGIELIRF